MQELDKTRVKLDNPGVWIDFSSSDLSLLRLGIPPIEPERHFTCLARVFGLLYNLFPTLEFLHIVAYPNWQEYWWGRVENAQWLKVFRSFFGVKNLHLSKEATLRIALALQELDGGKATEVFPALQNTSSGGPLPSGPVCDAIMQFATARRLYGHFIHISVPSSYKTDDG